MYPGGSGARIEQFIKIEDSVKVKNRIESPILPLWFENQYSGFIPDVQGGWSGPIISYYSRVDDKYRQFW